ncbi:MAG TPA: arylamine N-acetyltransferase [Kofleriaceae bacterium]
MDLDRYFERIGWRGARGAGDDVLAGLYAHHLRAIPFENLDVLLGRRVQIDLPALEAKLVHARRGGYCYEHATLFAAVLRALGFEVHTHSARVVMVRSRDEAPRTHMFLTSGRWLLDIGFGGPAPLSPVLLDGTPSGDHRFVRDGADHALEARAADGSWRRLWVSSLERDILIDFEMANHFTSTHPSSPFTQRLMGQAFTPAGKVAVANRDVTIIEHGQTRTSVLADRDELRALFAAQFGFDLPELARVKIPAIPEWP